MAQSNQKRNVHRRMTIIAIFFVPLTLCSCSVSSIFEGNQGRWESVAVDFNNYRRTPDTRTTLLAAQRFITKNKDPLTMPMGLAFAGEACWEAGYDEKVDYYLNQSLDACLKSRRYVGALNVYAIKANMALRAGNFNAANTIAKATIGLLDKLGVNEPENYDSANRTVGWLSNPFQIYLNLCNLYFLQNDPEGARLIAAGVVSNVVKLNPNVKPIDRRLYELLTAFATAASYETGNIKDARKFAESAQRDWTTDIVPADDDEFLAMGSEGPGLDIWTFAGCECLKAGDYDLAEKFFNGHEGLAFSDESVHRHEKALQDIANPNRLQPYLDPLHSTVRYLFTSGNDTALLHILNYLEPRVKNIDVKLDIQTEKAIYARRSNNKRLAAQYRHDALETARDCTKQAGTGSETDCDYTPSARWCLIFITNYAIMDGDFDQAKQALSLLDAHDRHPDHSHTNSQRRRVSSFFQATYKTHTMSCQNFAPMTKTLTFNTFQTARPAMPIWHSAI